MSIMREREKKLVILCTIHANHLEVFFNKMLLKHCMHKNGIVFVLNCSRFSVKEKRIRISSQTISPLSLTLARGRSSEKAAALNPGEEGRVYRSEKRERERALTKSLPGKKRRKGGKLSFSFALLTKEPKGRSLLFLMMRRERGGRWNGIRQTVWETLSKFYLGMGESETTECQTYKLIY